MNQTVPHQNTTWETPVSSPAPFGFRLHTFVSEHHTHHGLLHTVATRWNLLGEPPLPLLALHRSVCHPTFQWHWSCVQSQRV